MEVSFSASLKKEKLMERKTGLPNIFWWAGLLIVFAITGYPLLKLFSRMIQFDNRYSLEGLWIAFTAKKYLTPFWNTLKVGFFTTLFSILFGVPLALVVGRMQIPAGKILRIVLMIPYLIPGFVFAFAWRELVGPVGYINKFYMILSGSEEPLFNIYGFGGVVLILVLRGYPVVYITVVRALQNMNASYEEAAEISGAGRFTLLRTITFPLMLPAISGAALLVFASSIANFGVAAVLGIPANFYVLTTQIYATILSYGVDNNITIASCLSLYLIAAGLFSLWLQGKILKRRSYVVVTGKGGRKDLIASGRIGWVYTLVLSILGFLLVILPLTAVMLSSLTKAYGLAPTLENLTFNNFIALGTDTLIKNALRNSFIFAISTASLCVLIGFLIALVTERSRIPGRKFLDFLATAPRSIPGTIIALAFIIAWIKPIPVLGFSIYNTFLIMLMAYLAKFLGFTVRTITAALKQISPSLEEACLVSGGKSKHRIFDILVPLSREGIASGWLLVFIPCLNELTISILLYSSGKETIGVAVFSLLQEGLVGRASAFSILIISIVFIGEMTDVRFVDVSKKFGKVTAVSEFSLTVEEGEFITLLGPSGCGKTTTLRLLAGFCPPSSGSIEIGGNIVSDLERNVFVAPGKRKIGMVFQDYALWPHMNVLANTEYPLKIAGNSPAERKKKVKRILEVVKMEGMEARFPHELSGGQQQRIALARALVSDPKVLLLDEPLSNLDASLRDSMRVETKSIHKRLGVTIFFVTHDQVEAMSMSDRIVVMNSGVIQQLGTPEELYDFPANEFVASFLGKANFFKVTTNNGELSLRAGGDSFPFRPEKVIGNLEKGLGCVKPSDIDILKNTKKGIKGTIESSLFIGDNVIYYIRIGNLQFEVKTPDRSFQSDSAVRILFKRVMLF